MLITVKFNLVGTILSAFLPSYGRCTASEKFSEFGVLEFEYLVKDGAGRFALSFNRMLFPMAAGGTFRQ